jgi:pimeloyl-ACP methyl ester carboxylesterase
MVAMTDASLAGDARDGTIVLPGSRRLTYRSFGDLAGRPVIALHGTPGSRLKFSAADAAARLNGLRLIAPDRWGYGGSDTPPNPSLAAFADDIAALADRLGHRRFAALAVSGGGPYAVALAACYPQRVSALALFAPVGPIFGEALAMRPLHRFCFGPLAQRPRVVRAIFRGLRGLLRISPRLGLAAAMATVPAADRSILKAPGVVDRLAETFAEGLRPGASGPATDLAIFGAPWAVPIGAADVPARIWIGTDDRNVPISATQRLADALPRCELTSLDGAGHLWVALNYAAVLDWVSQASRADSRNDQTPTGAA